MKRPLNWVPVYIDNWLFGSIADEFTPDQESIWLRLLLLAGKDSGFIRANESMGYPISALAGLIRREPELVERTIKRAIDVEKLQSLENGILYVSSWERYRLTPQYRRRLEKGPSDSPRENKKSKVEESKGKGTYVSQKGNTGSQKGNNKDAPPENDDDGLLPIPSGIPFKARDELVSRKADIRRLSRLLAEGKHQDGEFRISGEQLERKMQAFNQLVKDLT
jgi:hypothetical protein